MGWKDLFRRWRAAPTVDFGGWEDEALQAHWKQRGQLTTAAREALAAELERRGLLPAAGARRAAGPPGGAAAGAAGSAREESRGADELAHDEQADELAQDELSEDEQPDDGPEDELPDDGADDGPAPGGAASGAPPGAGKLQLVTIVSSRAALLWEGNDELLLAVLPPRDGLAEPALPRPTLAPDERIAHVLVLDPLGRGWLPTDEEVRAAGLTAREVWRFTSDGRPAPALRTGEVACRPLPERLDLGQLVLRRVAKGGSAVRATWPSVGLVALLGPRVSPADLSRQPFASLLLGGLEPVAEADTRAWAAALDPTALGALRQVALLGGGRDVEAAQAREFLPGLGVDVHVVEPAAAPGLSAPAEALQAAALAGDAARVAALEPTVSDEALEQLFVVNVIAERQDLVERLAALRCERDPASGRAWFLRGAIATFGEDPTLAVAHYRRAATAERPEARAWANLAAVQAELGDDDGALATAEEGLRHLEGDEFLQTTRVMVRLRRDGAAAARETLAAHAATLPPQTVQALEATIADPPAELLARPAVRRRWPHIAIAACQAAVASAQSGRLDAAERLLRRAITLDRFGDAVVGALTRVGPALTSAGQPGRALALYDALLAERPDVPLVRFHRGAALLNLDRAGEAVAEYRACVAAAEDWDEARVHLVAALTALDRLDEADAELDVLEQRGVDPELVMSLDDEIERRREAQAGAAPADSRD